MHHLTGTPLSQRPIKYCSTEVFASLNHDSFVLSLKEDLNSTNELSTTIPGKDALEITKGINVLIVAYLLQLKEKAIFHRFRAMAA